MPTERDAQKLLNFAKLYGAKISFQIQVGDVVRLKSGGPEMTIVDIDEGNISTSVYFVGNVLFEMELPVECLALKVYETR